MPAEVKGAEQLVAKLRALAAKAAGDRDAAVAVGYTAASALPLHENVEMKWKGLSRDPRVRRIEQGGDPTKSRPRARKREPKGRFWDPQGKATSKFLEGPARELKDVFAEIVVRALLAGQTLSQALLQAGLRLQRESQQRCPIDTGNTRASAFTRLDVGGHPAQAADDQYHGGGGGGAE